MLARAAVPKAAVARRNVAVPSPPAPEPPRVREPVWLVRAVLVLFLVGFAAFLAREVYNFLRVL